MHNLCLRCFWIRLRMEHKLPFGTFPGIFSTIDSYTKRIVHRWFDDHGTLPPWLSELGDIVDYIEPPHWSKFATVDDEYNIRVRGEADGIFTRSDNSHFIVDYKTARHSGNQDALYPQYEAQLNAYAYIAEHVDLSPVTNLALIYMEPMTNERAVSSEINLREHGFAMGFESDIVHVPVEPELIRPLLALTREIYELKQPPDREPQGSRCKDCTLTDKIRDLL